MAGKGIIMTIILIVIALSVFAAIAPTAIINASSTAALTAGGVPASTIAIYALVGLIAVVAIIMLFLKAGMGGRVVKE